MAEPLPALVSTHWLEGALGAPDLRILDATWLMPDDPRDPVAEFEAGHIPGAVYLPPSALADPDDPRPGMLASDGQAAARLGALGISETCRIIIYDNSPVKSAARAWWALSRVYGAQSVALLDGGFAKWKAEGHPLEGGMPSPAPTRFAVAGSRAQVRDKAQMLANLSSEAAQVADARGPARFRGDEPEPRPGMAAGHIPGSVNLPYAALFDETGCWKNEAGLSAAFDAAGIDLDRPLVTSCGSGVTACVLAFGAQLLGKRDVAVYDGSWSEWGMDPDVPKALAA